jgi:uracil-DNA glycosylase family 4
MTNLTLQQLEDEMITCRRCPRLVEWREEVARVKRRAYRDFDYWGKPVPGFGDPQARVLIVGLAPGAHGSNRTGRMFTGDASGDFLFPALHKAGFASQPLAETRDDDLTLQDLFISAVCRCAPPGNKPNREEMDNCLPYLWGEMERLPQMAGIVALGKIGFDNVLRVYRQHGYEIPSLKFGHGAYYSLGEGLPWLLASYHPSRQNTQTGRLTEEMFAAIWSQSRELLDGSEDQA